MATNAKGSMTKEPASAIASPQRSLRGDLKRFTREKLLDAALETFTQQGYRGTSVEQIVDLAGTTNTTFYRHFASKTDLLPGLSHHLSKEVSGVLAKLDLLTEPTRADVRAWLDDFITMWKRMHWLCDAFWEAVHVDQTVASSVIPETMGTVSVMERLLSKLAPEKQDRVRARLALLVIMLDRVVAVHLATDDPRLAELMLEETASMFWLAIYGDPQ